jgi:hypothetical protein
MNTNRFFGFIILFLTVNLLPQTARAQNSTPPDTSLRVIQFSGMVMDRDSLTPLPFVAVVIRNSERGVYTNANGYYSIVVQEKDTVDFFTLGYYKATFVLGDTFASNAYNHVQTMKLDTFFLREAVIYPWPSKDRFKDAFLSTNVPSDDLERARANLAQAAMIQAAQGVAMDGSMAGAATMSQHVSKNYYAGQAPPNNLLNPVAWSRFLTSLKNGELKQQ